MLRRLVLLILAILVAGIALGIAALGFVDIPPPTSRIERAIPSDRMPR